MTREKETKKVIVNDVHQVRPVFIAPVVTTTQSTEYGNIEKITNDKTVIKTEQVQTIVKSVIQEQPQLATFKPVIVKSVTYGDL